MFEITTLGTGRSTPVHHSHHSLWLVKKNLNTYLTSLSMIGAVKSRAVASSTKIACRSLVSSARNYQLPPKTSPGTPVTSQPVKAEELHEHKPSPVVKEVVKKHNEEEEKKHQKKKFSFTGFLLKSAALTSVLYGATLYAATKNEKVMDFVIDKQLPYYEQLINLIENGSVEDIEQSWHKLTSSVQLPSKKQINELTSKWEQQGEHFIEETKKLATGKSSHLSTPAEQLQRAVEFETVSDVTEKLPKIVLPKDASFADEHVRATIKSFNDLISLIDASSIGPQKDALIKNINTNITLLATKLNKLNKSFDEEVQNRLKSAETELFSSYTQKELDMTRNMLEEFNQEKTHLENKYKAKLTKEVEAAREAISQAAVNATSMVRVEQTKRFESMVKEKIDQERNSRLKNLEAVNSRLEEIEAFATSLEKQITASSSKSAVQHSLSKLKSLLFDTKEDSPATSYKSYVENLESVTSKSGDEVISLAVSELKPVLDGESSQSILTIPQLLTAWEQLSPELRSASLLPPNAGLLGHLSSILFSKLLLPVKGAKPNGKDIESVIARVENSLTRGELDVAVEEVANLKGWSRKLADDWVKEGRKRLEAEFLVELIDAEAKIL
ncbi:MICOS complex subunit MIC60 [Clavispora lusitaniae]|uniref:MICOS complex subunit MIC60 n=2 Tax=Clavispora lusitaniae TaxID=36911 RepID=C4XVP6_CLAL4|nr:uncharacterized protein CLUG_00001 [Clavispora lusitaniae ATCC 42720]EEQ35878.1 hypothetical protein CLUG_00001 [Clavispora lusitaniae ATCC 42720]KAF7583931.1 MICOS complex subunit MIC60 [Clavispora lusitaniae]OVF06698.1 putative MICOS complex subunit MIC60 [Clavispora lusitaniae]